MCSNYRLSSRLSERDIHVLYMYLGGATIKEMTDYLVPEKLSEHEGKALLTKVMRRLGSTLRMPHTKILCIKNKESILENLRIVQEYQALHEEFIAKTDKDFAKSGFKDLSC